MRLDRIGSAVIVVAALAAGCATGPAATTRPSASVATPASPSPSTSPSPASIRPDWSAPIGSPAIHEAIVLDAAGTTEAAITGGDLRFTAKDRGAALCRSLPDSRAVSDVTALELGELGSGTLRAMLGVSAGTGIGTAEIFIDGGDLPEQSFLPSWTGRVTITSSTANGASGSMTFTALALQADPAGKPGLPAPAGVDEWPATLSGTVSWSCDPWAIPIASVAP
jgi:hypothetical protein